MGSKVWLARDGRPSQPNLRSHGTSPWGATCLTKLAIGITTRAQAGASPRHSRCHLTANLITTKPHAPTVTRFSSVPPQSPWFNLPFTFMHTHETDDRPNLVADSKTDRLYSKPCFRVQKHREQFDGPKSSIVLTFNGCPIPSDLVIVRVIP